MMLERIECEIKQFKLSEISYKIFRKGEQRNVSEKSNKTRENLNKKKDEVSRKI